MVSVRCHWSEDKYKNSCLETSVCVWERETEKGVGEKLLLQIDVATTSLYFFRGHALLIRTQPSSAVLNWHGEFLVAQVSVSHVVHDQLEIWISLRIIILKSY